MKVYSSSNIKCGDSLQWQPFGRVHNRPIIEVCDGTQDSCGVAARDIYAGETVTHDRYRNTKDILLKSGFDRKTVGSAQHPSTKEAVHSALGYLESTRNFVESLIGEKKDIDLVAILDGIDKATKDLVWLQEKSG